VNTTQKAVSPVTDSRPSDDTIRQAVELACRAPSLHNSQPWRWIVSEDGGRRSIELHADPTRIGRSTDRSGRELVMSCGAALDHLRVALAAAGWDSATQRFPNPNDPDHLATVTMRPATLIAEGVRERAEAITRRHTDRLPFDPPQGWDLVLEVLRRNVFGSDVTLSVLPEDARPKLAQASRLSESLRRYDASYQAELQWWTTPTWVTQGLPPESLPSAQEQQRVDVARAFPTRGDADRRPGVAHDRSVLAVISTPDDTPRDALYCGEALSALLLECTAAGLATCTLTHLMELQPSRDIVRELTGGSGLPQVLVRIGTATADHPEPTPRRPVDEVLEFRN